MAELPTGPSNAQMENEVGPSKSRETSANASGPQMYALAYATVVRVDYAQFEVDLRIQTGETTLRESVSITLPGAGNRHFFGSMPEEGDLCVVGWAMGESGQTRRPVILGWIIPGVTAGYDWLPTQPFSPSELGLSPKIKQQVKGLADRVRHKLRHMKPGNIIASSAQGADIVLTESVLLSNRRGNEVRLRDSDQAFIVRSLQQFHAGAGFRVYSGMVQRDATFLPTQVFSDGTKWNAPQQVDETGATLEEGSLGDADHDNQFLTPAKVFQRDEDGNLDNSLSFASHVDPFEFLQQGLFIDEQGYALGNVTSEAIYGGKTMYRVSTSGTNAIVDTAAETFTEHRIEISHTADGTLPVTEQTDGFDANRLPTGSPREADPLAGSVDAPFIHLVHGTVVGNDPFSESGRVVYGIPLRPVIFDGEDRNPTMASGLGSALGDHAASLYQMRPPLDAGGDPTFWTVTKDGRLMASIPGPGTTWSAELAFGAGIHIGAGARDDGRSLLADFDGGVVVRSRRGDNEGNIGVLISSDAGAVRLFGGGSTTVGGIGARNAPSGEGDGGLPAVLIESATNLLLKAAKTVTISATRLDLTNVQQLNLKANSGFNVQSGAGISHSSATSTSTTMGKASSTHSGPTNGNPTNGAVREITIAANPATGFPGGTADSYRMLYGNRTEIIGGGNHSTSVIVGNQVYSVGTGAFIASSAATQLALSAAGAALTTPGNAAITAGKAATLQAVATARVKGARVNLSAGTISFTTPVPGVKHSLLAIGQVPGGVLTDGCIDPITGKTFKIGGVVGIQTMQVF